MSYPLPPDEVKAFTPPSPTPADRVPFPNGHRAAPGRAMTIALIAVFGALGCLLRHALSGWVYGALGRGFPYGTLAVNVVGSFLIGLVMELGLRSTALPVALRTGLAIGLLGGLTTFSTFSYETFKLLEDGELLAAGINVLASVATCVLLTWAGIATARSLT
jgi:CrcB protein